MSRNRLKPDPWQALAVLAMLAAGCDLPGKPNPEDHYRRPEDVLEFSQLYRQHCTACHGVDGRMGAGPPLHDDLFRVIVPAAELEKVLNEGRPGTMMPPFAQKNGGTLTAQQIQILVNEIKGVSYRIEPTTPVKIVEDPQGQAPAWGVPRLPEPPPPPYRSEGVGSPGRGAEDFKRACAGCHGPDGQGILRNGRLERRLNDPVFLALTSDQVLRRYIITGRPEPGIEMPDYAGKAGRRRDFQPLTSQQIADVVALLASWRPSGSSGDR